WAPAAPENFQPANRPQERAIDIVVIHDIEGTAESAVKWFQNPKAQVSAHYVVGAGGRQVWQQVRERDIGWHAGNRDTNARSIGIEHDGFAYRPGFFDAGLYERSARLVRDITNRYRIPRDRQHIIAHAEVPHPTDPTRFGGRSNHTDPGPYWDWDYYMALVRNDARAEPLSAPAVIRPGEKLQLTARFTNTGDDPWPLQAGGRRNDAAQARGPVYLGVSSSIPGAVSPFYDRASWTSPRFVGPAQGAADTAPGETATFGVTLLGPRVLGTASEQLRLVKVPVAPRLPVPFGPALSLQMQVEPWRFIRDASAGFEAAGWHQKATAGRPLFWQRATRKQQPEPARWTVPLPIDGVWEVYTHWPAGRDRSRKVVYEIAAADGAKQVVVDQRKRAGWLPLGRFRFEGAKPAAVVTLAAEAGAPGTVVADSLRFVGPFPADAEKR
ncbi:MAG TPA: N-acetylmuramoyl-L-alanine amidase, partial [Armatimonadota bacterium]|nr:N-acetylmuramoyl-L-alanine amidase [Armatimonadota bacterium]